MKLPLIYSDLCLKQVFENAIICIPNSDLRQTFWNVTIVYGVSVCVVTEGWNT
jgi:hypothetical protein